MPVLSSTAHPLALPSLYTTIGMVSREVATSIESSEQKARALWALAAALAQAQQWDQAREVATAIEESGEKARALQALVTALVTVNENELALHIVQQSWLQAETRASALE